MSAAIALNSAEHINCIFSYKKYANADKSYCVCEYRNCDTNKIFCAVGQNLPTKKNLVYTLVGNWETNKKYGTKQLRVLFSEVPKVSDQSGIVAYLQSLKCGIGEKKAKDAYKRFKEKTWDIIEREPYRLTEIPGISHGTIEKLIASQKANAQNREIIKLFAGAGIQVTAAHVKSMIKKCGESTLDKLKEDPYLFSHVQGLSFDKCDTLALSMGFSKTHPSRLESGISYTFSMAAVRGHVCLPKAMMLEEMAKLLDVDQKACSDAINRAWQAGKVKGANGMLFSLESFNQEKSISDNLVRLLQNGDGALGSVDTIIEQYERENFPLAESQRDAVRNVFRNQVNIITGGPGTGKTTVTKAILYVHRAVYGESSNPVLLAPTGRASRRLSDATGYPATTIHSAVGYKVKEDDETVIETTDGPLCGNVIIVDEASMMDQMIASVLLDKVEDGAKVVFVGDPDQLPSVGCGNVLLDMIRSRVIPTTKLTVIYRQAGENPIVANAHAINSGRHDLVYTNSFKFLETSSDMEAFRTAGYMYVRSVKAYGLDNVVLLNPQRNNTNLSVDVFNRALQDVINPRKEGELTLPIGRIEFRIGDKVMQLKNTDEARNGDIGYIKDIIRKPNESAMDEWQYSAIIEWNEDGHLYEYTPDMLATVDLAYCSTVHKSQGEEYNTVIMVVSKAHPAMLKRNLIYTGITRAKVNVALVGEKEALDLAIDNDKCEERYTLLANRLNQELASS